MHSVLLTLWDIARGNPDYDRKLWGELQCLINDLETKNKIFCAIMADMLRATELAPEAEWDPELVNSPPEGYAMKFIRDELSITRDNKAIDSLMGIQPPAIPTKSSKVAKRNLKNHEALEPSPQTDEERYDGGDESLDDSSDELVFDLGTTD
jgi:hypothetical protein